VGERGVKIQNDHAKMVFRNLHGEGNFGIILKFLSKFGCNWNYVWGETKKTHGSGFKKFIIDLSSFYFFLKEVAFILMVVVFKELKFDPHVYIFFTFFLKEYFFNL
jgi:hypothetical protein